MRREAFFAENIIIQIYYGKNAVFLGGFYEEKRH